MAMDKAALNRRFLSVDGQIIVMLASGAKNASDIYNNVSASQPTISEKIARMIMRGEVVQLSATGDRRIRTYVLAPGFRQSIAHYLHVLEPLIDSEARQSGKLVAAD